jgi:hypothetical protein
MKRGFLMCNIYIYYSVKAYNNGSPEVTLKGDILKTTGHNVVITDNEGYEHVISMFKIVAIVHDRDYSVEYSTPKPISIYYSEKAYNNSRPEIEFNGAVTAINEHNILVSGEQSLSHIVSTFPIVAFVHEGGTEYEIK